ncbi:MAG: glycosyltransferase family 39 protein [Microthrixaceae bacterium]|nr:glycosyltransferase family 39 protein [Microthrixaceae bacterium]
MSSTRPDRRFFGVLAAIMALGLAIRLGFVIGRQSQVVLNGGDAYWYHFQAKLVARGDGFLHPFYYFKEGVLRPGADHPPGFVLILAFLDLIGIDSAQGQRLVMTFVGTATIAVVALVGRRIANPRTGLIAAFLAAVYPNFWINDGMLMVETIFILATAVALLGVYRYFEQPSVRDAILVSVSLTVAAMTRPEALLLFVMLALPLVIGPIVAKVKEAGEWGPSLRNGALHLGVMALIPIVAFTPWVLYNLSRFETPVLISTGAGQTLAVGNCELTYSGDFLGFYDTNCLLPPQITPPDMEDLSVADIEYRRIALEFMSNHKRRLPVVIAARVGRQWHLFRAGQSIGLDGYVEGRSGGPPGSSFWPVREALWSYYALIPMAIAGLIVLRRRSVKIWPLLSQPILVTLVAAGTFGITRYRAGAEVSIVLAAAVAIECVAAVIFTKPDDQEPVGETPQGETVDV